MKPLPTIVKNTRVWLAIITSYHTAKHIHITKRTKWTKRGKTRTSLLFFINIKILKQNLSKKQIMAFYLGIHRTVNTSKTSMLRAKYIWVLFLKGVRKRQHCIHKYFSSHSNNLPIAVFNCTFIYCPWINSCLALKFLEPRALCWRPHKTLIKTAKKQLIFPWLKYVFKRLVNNIYHALLKNASFDLFFEEKKIHISHYLFHFYNNQIQCFPGTVVQYCYCCLGVGQIVFCSHSPSMWFTWN